MSLGIFSFDLAAIINSLSNFMASNETDAAAVEMSLYRTEDVLQMAATSDTVIDDVLMAAALTSAVTSVISSNAEVVKNETPKEQTPVPKPAARPANTLDEETRKEIERLIKSLQTSVVHNYQSTDIIDESVAHNTVANFAQRRTREDSDNRKESIEQQKKSDERRLEHLRDELKRAILRNNTDV